MMSSEHDSRAEPAGALHRLHPMTLGLRIVVSAPAILFLMLPFLRHPDTASIFNLITALLYALVIVPWLVIHYARFRYGITAREIVIESGVATRRRRSIPIERIQNVEIEQQLLQRLTGTARVRIFTAGSPKPEGSLEVVSLAEAERIREAVRTRQVGTTTGPGGETELPGGVNGDLARALGDGIGSADVSRPDAHPRAVREEHVVFSMTPAQVLLSGTFRFSMVYLALAFSLLQYWEEDPAILITRLMRGPLSGLGDIMAASPGVAIVAGIALAGVIGWISGILVQLNRWFRFSLTLDDGKLQIGHGLLSLRRTTIPLRKVQMLIVRTNPLMRRFGWYTLQVQTMGFDVKEQGHAMVVPFARMDDVRRVAETIRAGMPDRGERFVWPETLEPVSRLTIRRAFIRYSFAVLLVTVPAVYEWSTWGWSAAALLPFAWVAAVVRWRHMGYTLEHDHLIVRRGFLRQLTWIMPLQRTQVVYTRASLFQRRLGLATLYVDTAGASPVSGPDLIDLSRDLAGSLAARVYSRFQTLALDSDRFRSEQRPR